MRERGVISQSDMRGGTAAFKDAATTAAATSSGSLVARKLRGGNGGDDNEYITLERNARKDFFVLSFVAPRARILA